MSSLAWSATSEEHESSQDIGLGQQLRLGIERCDGWREAMGRHLQPVRAIRVVFVATVAGMSVSVSRLSVFGLRGEFIGG
jgi:hypothetical protein